MRNLQYLFLSKRPDPHRDTAINPRSIIAAIQNPTRNVQLEISGRQILLCPMTPHSQGLALSYELTEKRRKVSLCGVALIPIFVSNLQPKSFTSRLLIYYLSVGYPQGYTFLLETNSNEIFVSLQ